MSERLGYNPESNPKEQPSERAGEILTNALDAVLNTAGLSSIRNIGVGLRTAYDRAQTISREIASGERTDGFMQEYFVNGFKETWDKLRMHEGATTTDKILNAIDSLTVALNYGNIALGQSKKSIDSTDIDLALDGLETQPA